MTRELLPCYSEENPYSKWLPNEGGFQSHLLSMPGAFLSDTFSSLNSAFTNLHLRDVVFIPADCERKDAVLSAVLLFKDAVSIVSCCIARRRCLPPKRHLNKTPYASSIMQGLVASHAVPAVLVF